MSNDFFKLEDEDYDLPLLNNDSRFTKENVIILLIGLVIASAVPFLIPVTEGLLKAILTTGFTLIPVIYVFKDDMSNIFRKPQLKDMLIIIIGLILLFLCSFICKYVMSILGLSLGGDSAVNGNPVILIIRAAIQLIGEELIKFIALILVTAYLYKAIGRKIAIILGITVSQIIFSVIHLPAYGFNNLIQLLISIGVSSVVLPLTYVKTKNLVLCYIIHLLNDLIAFIPFFLGITVLISI